MSEQASASLPVRLLPGDQIDAEGPRPGIALCLSGGGYRAMVFHVGSLWRLHELGLLAKLDRISSVSGGSITAGALGLHWSWLQEGRGSFEELVAAPIRALASRTIDREAIIGGIVLPGTITDKVAAAYDRYLFAGVSLQALPDKPRFVLNATNVKPARCGDSRSHTWGITVSA